jgi:hypothetical protein
MKTEETTTDSNIADVLITQFLRTAVSLNQRKTYFLFKINESQGDKKNLGKSVNPIIY